jgi:hypothetical protein
MIRLVASRADTGEIAAAADLEDLQRWMKVLQGLDLRKEQLRQIVAHHSSFAASIALVRQDRAAILQQLQEVLRQFRPPCFNALLLRHDTMYGYP